MSGEEILCDVPGAVKHFRPDLAGPVADRAAAIDPRYRDVDGARRASRRRRTGGGTPEGVDSFRAGPWSGRLDRCETACWPDPRHPFHEKRVAQAVKPAAETVRSSLHFTRLSAARPWVSAVRRVVAESWSGLAGTLPGSSPAR